MYAQDGIDSAFTIFVKAASVTRRKALGFEEVHLKLSGPSVEIISRLAQGEWARSASLSQLILTLFVGKSKSVISRN